MDFIASTDSMASNFGSRVKAHKAGVSNSMERRTKEMSVWMRLQREADRREAASGDG